MSERIERYERLSKLQNDWIDQEVREGRIRRGQRAIVIRFDPETYAQVAELAAANKISFAEQVRTFCEWGIEDVFAKT